MSAKIDQKDMDLYKQKEKEYNESVKKIKSKKEDFEKKCKSANIEGIKKNVEKIKKKCEDIKERVEKHEKENEENKNK